MNSDTNIGSAPSKMGTKKRKEKISKFKRDHASVLSEATPKINERQLFLSHNKRINSVLVNKCYWHRILKFMEIVGLGIP